MGNELTIQEKVLSAVKGHGEVAYRAPASPQFEAAAKAAHAKYLEDAVAGEEEEEEEEGDPGVLRVDAAVLLANARDRKEVKALGWRVAVRAFCRIHPMWEPGAELLHRHIFHCKEKKILEALHSLLLGACSVYSERFRSSARRTEQPGVQSVMGCSVARVRSDIELLIGAWDRALATKGLFQCWATICDVRPLLVCVALVESDDLRIAHFAVRALETATNRLWNLTAAKQRASWIAAESKNRDKFLKEGGIHAIMMRFDDVAAELLGYSAGDDDNKNSSNNSSSNNSSGNIIASPFFSTFTPEACATFLRAVLELVLGYVLYRPETSSPELFDTVVDELRQPARLHTIFRLTRITAGSNAMRFRCGEAIQVVLLESDLTLAASIQKRALDMGLMLWQMQRAVVALGATASLGDADGATAATSSSMLYRPSSWTATDNDRTDSSSGGGGGDSSEDDSDDDGDEEVDASTFTARLGAWKFKPSPRALRTQARELVELICLNNADASSTLARMMPPDNSPLYMAAQSAGGPRWVVKWIPNMKKTSLSKPEGGGHDSALSARCGFLSERRLAVLRLSKTKKKEKALILSRLGFMFYESSSGARAAQSIRFDSF